MQLATKHNTVQTGNVLASAGFGIAKNAKMFNILSDSMYKDKIGSMVRELFSNARDAHVMAGTPLLAPIIHLPTAFEPWFSVKDFGTGISPDDIINILCVYGVSTKDQSNDAIGAFGLGAKTPFAYTDNFTVISTVDGMVRTYTACIGEDGMPTLVMQTEEATDAHNGFEIIVTVDEGDFQRFADKTLEQLKFFPVKPEFDEGGASVEFPELDTDQVAYKSDLVTMYGGYASSPIHALYVVQGGVGYPVDLDELDGLDSNTMSFAKALENAYGYMEFPIGEIDVTAPREAVSYDDRTIKNIGDRIASIASAMSRDVMATIRKEQSIWNRAVIFNKQIGVIQKAVKQSPDFDKLFAGMDVDRHGKLAVNMDDLVALDMNAVNMFKFSSYRSNSRGTTVRRKVLGNMSHYGDEYLTAAQEVNVFLRDTNSKPMARAKHFVIENDFPLTIVIEHKWNTLVGEDRRAAVAKALRMPVANVRLLSELEAPATVRGAGGAGGADYTAPKAYEWNSRKSNTCSRDWERLYDDLNDIGAYVYVEMFRHDILGGDDVNLVFAAADAGQLPYDIIAVNGKTAERIRAGKIGADLISAEQAAAELREKQKALKTVFVKYARDEAFLSNLRENAVMMELLSQGRMADLRKQFDNISERVSWMGETVSANSWMRYHFGSDTRDAAVRGKNRAAGIEADFHATFPMLKYVTGSYGRKLEPETLADVLTYIDSVEKGQAGVDTSA